MEHICEELNEGLSTAPHFNPHALGAQPTEETLKSKVKRFLEDLKDTQGYDDHRKHTVLMFNNRDEVYTAAVSSEGYGLETLNHSTFMQYWSTYEKDVHIRLGRERCARCAHFDDDSVVNPENALTDVRMKEAHKQHAEAQQQLSQQWATEARQKRESVLSFCCDNAAKIRLPKRAIAVQKESSLIHIDLVMSNIHNDGTNKASYYVNHEAWSETGASTITAIYRAICDNRLPSHRTLYLHFDNHSTNKCNVLLAFLQYLVLLDYFEVIQVLFFIAYEAKNRADRDHARMHVAINKRDVFSPQDFVEILLRNGIKCEWLTEIRDWDRFFKDFTGKFPDIQQPHQ